MMTSSEESKELDSLYTILKGILQNDNLLRKTAETQLKAWLNTPVKLLDSLAKLVQLSHEDYIKKLASVLFNHFLELEPVVQCWKNALPAQQHAVKADILQSLRTAQDIKVARQVCQAIAGLASTIFDAGQDWPELEGLIVEYMGQTDGTKETALLILRTLFSHCPERYVNNMPQICGIFDSALMSQTQPVLVAAVEAICTFLAEVESTATKQLHKYAGEILRVASTVSEEGLLQRVLEVVSEVAETEPTFFRKFFDPLCEVMLKISAQKHYANEKLRQMPLETLITVMERIPGLVKKHKEQLWKMCEAVFDMMVSIDEEVDEGWLRPKEGYNTEEESNPDDNVNFGMISYDRLLEALDEEMFPIMEKVLEVALSSEDWRYRHAGLMAIAQIGEYAGQPEKVKNVVPILLAHLVHIHPKVRFAALYAVGLMAEDMSPDFQEVFDKVLLPPLVQAIDDPVPRVQAHVCAALTNFLEHVRQEVACQVAPVLLPKLVKLIREGISIIKESAMTCIASIAESCGDKFLPYYRELVTFIVACIQQSSTKEYSRFKGQAIECLSIIGASIGKLHFLEFAPSVVQLLKGLQEAEFNKEDPQKFYLLGAWQRICLILGKDLAPYLSEVVPKLLVIAGSGAAAEDEKKKQSFEDVLHGLNKDKKDKYEITTTEIEEKEVALQMLTVFCAQLEETFQPYVETATLIVRPILTFEVNSEIRRSAATLIPTMLNCVAKANPGRENVVAAGKHYLADLLMAHDQELKAEIKSAQVLAMKRVLDLLGDFMKEEEVDGMFKKIFSFASESNERRTALLATKESLEEEPGEEMDENLCDQDYEDNAESEEQYQKSLTYLLGAVINGHKEKSLKHVPAVIERMIKPNLTGSVNQQKAALFVADDLLEFMGAAKLGATLWKQLAETVLQYVGRPEHELRQAACYGVGNLAKCGGVLFPEIAVYCLTVLAAAVEIKEDKKKQTLWVGAKESAIVAIGKILKYQTGAVPFAEIWGRWLAYLPVKEDENEAKEVHGFVAEHTLSSPDSAIGPSGANLFHLIRIFVTVYPTDLVTVEAKTKIAAAIKQLGANPAVAPMLEDIFAKQLRPREKEMLQAIIK